MEEISTTPPPPPPPPPPPLQVYFRKRTRTTTAHHHHQQPPKFSTPKKKNIFSGSVENKGPLKGKKDITIKKRSQPRAKICKLLTMDEGTELNKQKLWEERARSFISCMNCIQGNRRFTRWKGSVVDSVIGAYLTQNVSDNISSSAFISLAARFPLDSTSYISAHNKEVKQLKVDKAKVQKLKGKKGKVNSWKARKVDFSHWEQLRKEVVNGKATKDKISMDREASLLDHEALRCAEVGEVAHAIMGRGQHNNLAERIKDFLNKIVENHESIDLEWLRHIPPDEAKKYLMKIYGLGMKSVECIRLLTLHQAAFPVDTNVGRIAVRLGWVPIQPSSEDDLLHELEKYPLQKIIQEYLWPRLCKLDQATLYELHYQMITFGKVFCTKRSPNCKACPMSAECKHYASELSSKGLTLPWTEEEAVVPDIEDAVYKEKPVEIPKLLPDVDLSEALVAVSPEAASVSMRKLKNVTSLRTEYHVYELPDKHHLLNGLDKRLEDDPCPYLLLACAPGETEESIKPSERCHSLLESGNQCLVGRCLSCDRIRKRNSEIVQGTLLLPVKTTMRGGFPLNGTYFQLNEVFTDQESSLCPIAVQRALIWDLRRSFVYFGTSVNSIYKGLLKEDIQRSFHEGYICVRGFNRKTRAPCPLPAVFQATNKQKQLVTGG